MRRWTNRISFIIAALFLCLVCVLRTAYADDDVCVATFPASDDEQTSKTGRDMSTTLFFTKSMLSANGITYLIKGTDPVIGTDDLLMYMFAKQEPEGTFEHWKGSTSLGFFADHYVAISSSEQERLRTGAWTKRCAIFVSILPELVSPPEMNIDATSFDWKIRMRDGDESLDYMFAKYNDTLKCITDCKENSEYDLFYKTDGMELVVEVRLRDAKGNVVQKASTVLAKKGAGSLKNVENGFLFYNLTPSTDDNKVVYYLDYHIYGRYSASDGMHYKMLYPLGDKLEDTWSSRISIQTTAIDGLSEDETKSVAKLFTYRFSWNTPVIPKGNLKTDADRLANSTNFVDVDDFNTSGRASSHGFTLAMHHYLTQESKVSKRAMKSGNSGYAMDLDSDPMEIINTGVLTTKPSDATNTDAKMLSSWFLMMRLGAITLCAFGMLGAIIRIATPGVSGFALFRLRQVLSGWVALLFVIGASTFILSFIVQILFY